jgi:hypothetical protein
MFQPTTAHALLARKSSLGCTQRTSQRGFVAVMLLESGEGASSSLARFRSQICRQEAAGQGRQR